MNYYSTPVKKIEDLLHFPFKSMEEFKRAVNNNEVKDIGVAMDIAREWVMETRKSTFFQRYSRLLLAFLPWILVLFYLIEAFIIPNYWLLLYSILPLIVFFTGSPFARKINKLHYIILGAFILIWAFTGNLPLIYWVPIVLLYLSLDYIYKGSAKIIRKMVTEDEDTLCYFWKWSHMNLLLSNGIDYNQRYKSGGGSTQRYDDVEKEWKEFIKLQDGK